MPTLTGFKPPTQKKHLFAQLFTNAFAEQMLVQDKRFDQIHSRQFRADDN